MIGSVLSSTARPDAYSPVNSYVGFVSLSPAVRLPLMLSPRFDHWSCKTDRWAADREVFPKVSGRTSNLWKVFPTASISRMFSAKAVDLSQRGVWESRRQRVVPVSFQNDDLDYVVSRTVSQ